MSNYSIKFNKQTDKGENPTSLAKVISAKKICGCIIGVIIANWLWTSFRFKIPLRIPVTLPPCVPPPRPMKMKKALGGDANTARWL